MCQNNDENPPEYEEPIERDYTLEEVEEIEEMEAERGREVMGW